MVTWFDGSKGGMPPVTAPGAVTPDERPGDYLEYYDRDLSLRRVQIELRPDRYPPPAEADLVTLWKRNGRVVMSLTADGKTQDFYMPPARLVYLLRECAEQLAENTLIQ